MTTFTVRWPGAAAELKEALLTAAGNFPALSLATLLCCIVTSLTIEPLSVECDLLQIVCLCVHSRDTISRESSHWLHLLSGGWGMPSLPLAYWSRGQLRLMRRVLVEQLSAAHKPSDSSFLPHSVQVAHSPNPIQAIRSVRAGQPGNTEFHLIS